MIKVGDFLKYTGITAENYTTNKSYEIYYSDIKAGYIIDDYNNKSAVYFDINMLNTVYWEHITLTEYRIQKRKQKLEKICLSQETK